MPNKLELLAPAGSMDALKAALANGADAVYLGAAAFGARASAGFDEEMLKEALALAHLHRRKIYVTVNILVKEEELPAVRKTLALLDQLRADAVLVQDLGILKLCREEYPALPVHASTQMALHNAKGASLLKALGAKRVVLARECTLSDMREAAATGIEVEAFCHGAMCVCVSGQCLLSSMIGGRSGNRGRCAQPCRLPYTYQGMQGAFLSPRDLCARDLLGEMAEAGVCSFKIEGRLKRPEYVAEVTRAYRAALDAILKNRFSPATAAEKEALTQIFSRGGFTSGYPGACEDAGIIDLTHVTPQGVAMGKTGKCYRRGQALLCDVPLLRPLHNGDGLEIGEQILRYSGPEVQQGCTATLRLRQSVPEGAAVRRTEDESQLATARATYEGEAFNRALPLPFDAHLTARPGLPLSLYVTDGESHITMTDAPCEAAKGRPLDAENARKAMEKTGGTPFVLRDFSIETENAFASAAVLNRLRRNALAQLADARIAAHFRAPSEKADFSAAPLCKQPPRLLVKTSDASSLASLLASGADAVLFQPQDYRDAALLPLLTSLPRGCYLCLPAQCTANRLVHLRKIAREREIPLCLSSPGQLDDIGDSDMAGTGIPVMNSEALRMLANLGVKSATLSGELSKTDLLSLPPVGIECILPVYGRLRLMLLNHCPMRTALGLEEGKAQCELCHAGKGTLGTRLIDRMQAQYPLHPLRLAEGCQVELLSAEPVHLSQQLQGINHLSFLLSFTDEPLALQKQLLCHYRALLKGQTPPLLPISGTIGRFADGVL